MADFGLWFKTGLTHILDPGGLDHILYIMVLVLPFGFRQWKSLLWLVTAFTLGHSLTLALSTFGWLQVKASWVEVCIAATISISCWFNLSELKKQLFRLPKRYLLATLFGCIHGLGFSFLLRSMLGSEGEVLWPLMAFNLGLEAGQCLILITVMGGKLLLNAVWPDKENIVTTTMSFVILLLSLYYIYHRLQLIFEP